MTTLDDFRPAWWLPGPHAQTLWPVLCRRRPRLALRRERLELPDGDFLDLDWTPGDHSPMAPRMPVRVFGKGREVRERGRGGMSAVLYGKRTAL